MKDLGIQHGSTRPKDIEITNTAVFIATNIHTYSDDQTSNGYEYNYYEYSKDEYIEALILNNNNNSAKITQLEEELAAAKILLGVE